ncbi:MAG: arginine--tRNA ligase [Bacteroidales bacterium]
MEKTLIRNIEDAVKGLYGQVPDISKLQIQETRKEFEGDITVVVFPLLQYSKKSPEQTATDIGNYILDVNPGIDSFNVVKGFLNLRLNKRALMQVFNGLMQSGKKDFFSDNAGGAVTLVEYSSPNTNKPLHLGHIRNNLLGYSLSRILTACGHRVYKTNIVNDRGIHICKSMLAWKLFGEGKTPADTGIKGDHFVGKYYVEFENAYRKEIEKLVSGGLTPEEAAERSELMAEARELLRKWEAGDRETVELWQMMNSWVYEGFDATYRELGVDFDKIYYESDTYKKGREIISYGLKKGLFYKKDDGSVWVELSGEDLDEKLLLRADGTAVYMTQDLGTAVERYNDFSFERQYYVVGNEQNHHFKVLKIILKRLGYEWAGGIHHFSYGMVNLPEGRMKSREGKIVDADDLLATMFTTASEMSDELGKLHDFSREEKERIHRKIGLAALKYFILKVDPRKNMLFNPRESIDFNGNTGPFIQYTYARIRSVLRKAGEYEGKDGDIHDDPELNEKEKELIKLLGRFDDIIADAAEMLNPSIIANYVYDLAREFNQFYHDYSILGEEDVSVRLFRIRLSDISGETIKRAMWLLGIDMPERM